MKQELCEQQLKPNNYQFLLIRGIIVDVFTIKSIMLLMMNIYKYINKVLFLSIQNDITMQA